MTGASEVEKTETQLPSQLEFPATQPAEWLRLQQEVDLWEPQHVIPRANSGCRGAAYDAQNAVSANTARVTRPFKREYDITSR
jgi:hypothetical protein